MSKLAKIKDKQGEAYTFYCPGCDMAHIVPVQYASEYSHRNGKPKPVWAFNGDMDKPSFKPSITIDWKGAEPPQKCHCIIRDGEIIFLVDSTHKMSGARIKMGDTL